MFYLLVISINTNSVCCIFCVWSSVNVILTSWALSYELASHYLDPVYTPNAATWTEHTLSLLNLYLQLVKLTEVEAHSAFKPFLRI